MLKILVCAFWFYSQTTLAANLYHCGNSYQDSPCKEAASSKAIKGIVQTTNNPTASENQPVLKIDADCKQRGEAAKKIMWAREVGKTADQQLEAAQDGYTHALVRDVYNHRGSSLEVKNAIEQECMQQREQDKLAAKLIIEAQRLRGGTSVTAESSANSQSQLKTADTEETKIGAIENRANNNGKQSNCAALKSSLENITAKRRSGGSASYMNDLKQRQDQLASDVKSSGC